MRFDERALAALLPAVLRRRDAEIGAEIRAAQGAAADLAAEDFGPLRGLLAVLAEQVQALEQDLSALYDDQFIETCAGSAVPVLGELVGATLLREEVRAGPPRRAEVARTIALRRRKGTITALETLAANSTGWPAMAVEFFPRLAATQHLNRLRLAVPATVDLRDGVALQALSGPFDRLVRTVDVRGIGTGRGRHNLPNIGVFLWRLASAPRTRSTPRRVGSGGRRFRFHPLGRDLPLQRRPAAGPDLDARTAPAHLPTPISRATFKSDPPAFYGPDASVCIFAVGDDGELVPVEDIDVCDLADLQDLPGLADPAAGDEAEEADWQLGGNPERTRLDPERGRFVLADDLDPATAFVVRYHAGVVADLGGGEYDRSTAIAALADLPVVHREPDEPIGDALGRLGGGGGAVLLDTGETLAGPVTLTSPAGGTLGLLAGDGHAPVLDLSDDDGDVVLLTAPGSTLVLDGLLITGGVRITPSGPGAATVVIRDCTLVPGRSLRPDGAPVHPGAPSLVVDGGDVDLRIERSILGGIHGPPGVVVSVRGSIVDAGSEDAPAFGGPDGAGGRLSAVNSTVIGRVHATEFGEVTNALFAAREQEHAAGPRSVEVERRQDGCVRFSFVPLDALVPRRYRCQPETATAADRVRPAFTSLRYGDPGYGQLRLATPPEVAQGAEDESEMGAYHDVQHGARVTNLRLRLGEFPPVTMDAGIFFES